MDAKTKAKKCPTGRPTKFKEEYCQMLIEHMALGFSFESFAGLISVNQDTLHEWCKVHAIFSEAKKLAFAKCQLFWEAIGMEGLWSTKERSLNTGNYVFQMKNRFKWTDRVEVAAPEDPERKPLVLAYKL